MKGSTTKEMGRQYSKNGGSRSAFKVLAGKPEGKRPLGVDGRTLLDLKK